MSTETHAPSGDEVIDRTAGKASDEEIAGGSTAVASAAAVRRRASTTSRRRMWVVGVVVLAAIGFLLFKGVTSAIVFFKTANEAIAQRASLGDRTFQLEGTVLNGSVHHLGGDEYKFTVAAGGDSIVVDNTGDPPQLFRPGLAVVVVGHFVGSTNQFASDQIMVKHSQQYIAAHPGRIKSGNP